jgi:hypothetical protein
MKAEARALKPAAAVHTWRGLRRVDACCAERQAAAHGQSCSAAESALLRSDARARLVAQRGSWRDGRRRALHARAAGALLGEGALRRARRRGARGAATMHWTID